MPVLPLEPDDPREIGRYRLTGRLGEGGQGVVFLGEAPGGRPVAVKMLKTTASDARARFVREMESARRVAPFCTAAVLDSAIEDRHPYVVSEYVDGPSLQERVAERGPLRGGDLDRLVVNTASGLAAIHGAGVVHRDLKPANVLLGPDGPRVVDFGIARAVDSDTQTQMVGTPAYFAPEWLRGEPPTPASDIFAWAGTMVFAATGRTPFGPAANLPQLLHRIGSGEPDLTGVPDALRGLLAECLDKDPRRRPTARDLLVRLVDPSAPAAGPASPSGGTQPGEPAWPVGPVSPPAWPGGPPAPHLAPAAYEGTAPRSPAGRARGGTGRWAAAAAAVAAVVVAGVVWFVISSGEPGETAGRGRASLSPGPARDSGGTPATGTGRPSGGAPQTGRGTAIPAGFAGVWTGRVEQPAGLATENASDLTIRFPAGAATGTADYTGWGCKATLTPTEATDDTLTVTETLTGGPVGCQGGTVKLTLSGTTMTFTSPGLLGDVTGTLRRDG